MLVSEEEGVHDYSITSILYKKLVIHQNSPFFSFFVFSFSTCALTLAVLVVALAVALNILREL